MTKASHKAPGMIRPSPFSSFSLFCAILFCVHPLLCGLLFMHYTSCTWWTCSPSTSLLEGRPHPPEGGTVYLLEWLILASGTPGLRGGLQEISWRLFWPPSPGTWRRLGGPVFIVKLVTAPADLALADGLSCGGSHKNISMCLQIMFIAAIFPEASLTP